MENRNECDYFELGVDNYCKHYTGKKPCNRSCVNQCSIMESKREMEKGHTYKKEHGRVRQVR